jgi:hypothetical protein
MKIRIANLLNGAAGTLVLAGSLSVPVLIRAQTSPYPILDRPIAVGRDTGKWRPPQRPAYSPHVMEMKVELAWLADPVTSPYRLEARIVGSTVEVHGQVLNEAILGHAVQLARAESGMPVVTRVQLNPALRAPSGGKPQEILHRQAFQALWQAFPAQAPAITISTLAGGEIVLKGTVPTYEDKLAISRHLRQATTCSCILNQLQVSAEIQQNRSSSSRTAAATLLVPAPLKPQAVQQVGYLAPAESVALGSPYPTPYSSAEATRAGASSSSSQIESTAKPAAKPIVYQTKWRRLQPGELTLPSKTVPPATYKDTVKAPAPKQATAASKPRTYLPLFPSSKANQTPAAKNPNPTANTSGSSAARGENVAEFPRIQSENVAEGARIQSPVRREDLKSGDFSYRRDALAPPPRVSSPALALVSSQETPAARPPSLPTPIVRPSPVYVPPAQPVQTSLAKQEPYVTDGVILVESMIKPASHAVSAPGQQPLPIVKTGPYVTSGVILFSDPATRRGQPASPALAALQTQLQQRIAAACGRPSRDVEVTAVTETNLSVRVKANSTLEGEEFSNRIFQLPELGPCQVSLDVLVMK